MPTSVSSLRSIVASVALIAATTLLLGAAGAQARGHDLRVAPKKADVGERTCFEARVLNDRGRPVARSEVVLGGSEEITNRRGKARLCEKLEWPGAHTAQAFKGSERDSARIRARSLGVGATGEWSPVEIRLLAYYRPEGRGSCNPVKSEVFDSKIGTYGVAKGWCEATPQPGDAGPFTDKDVTRLAWAEGPKIDIDVSNAPEGTKNTLHGYVTGRNSGDYYVQVGKFGSQTLSGGTDPDPAKRGQPGGPLLINVTPRIRDGFEHIGYTIHIKGYVYG